MKLNMPWKYSVLIIVVMLASGSIAVWMGIVGGNILRNILKDIAAPETQTQADMPTFEDIQQMLVDRGYNIEIDGRIGKETLKAWDTEICNQEASKMFERMAK